MKAEITIPSSDEGEDFTITVSKERDEPGLIIITATAYDPYGDEADGETIEVVLSEADLYNALSVLNDFALIEDEIVIVDSDDEDDEAWDCGDIECEACYPEYN